MARILLLMLLLGACSKGPETDLQYIGDARSLAAEWALVNEQAEAGKLNATYVDSMHDWIGQQLQTDISSLTQPEAPYAAEIKELSRLPAGTSAQQLRSHAGKLKQVEESLESA